MIMMAILGAAIGSIFDRIFGPYLMRLSEEIFNINIYTPIIFSALFVLLFKKIIDNIDI